MPSASNQLILTCMMTLTSKYFAEADPIIKAKARMIPCRNNAKWIGQHDVTKRGAIGSSTGLTETDTNRERGFTLSTTRMTIPKIK